MRLLFLVPMSIHKVTAGSRIRYDRLAAASSAAAGGHFDLQIRSLEELAMADLEACDVCVLSKTYSAEAIALALQLRQKGKIVGIDLFDDYFSQTSDARLIRFRTWLRRIVGICHFALCSTDVMRRLLASYAPGLPVHVVPDPFSEIDPSVLARTAAEKLERARTERVIDVVWYGNGSHPFFDVGLPDIAAFSWSLADLASGSFDVRLNILTDQASQTSANMVRLSRLPVRYYLKTWSLETEKEALEQALVAFIPVNGQSFSRAKSLNRALTAISAGTQVLSPGFPLYRDLSPAIYTDGLELLSDIKLGKCRIGEANMAEVVRAVSDRSNVDAVLRDLSAFLLHQAPFGRGPTGGVPSRQAVIYGSDHDALMMRTAQVCGVLSVKSPLAWREHSYDIKLEAGSERELEVWIVPKLVPLLSEALRAKCSRSQQVGNQAMLKVNVATTWSVPHAVISLHETTRAIVRETEPYRQYMDEVERVSRTLFPTVQFLRSDLQHGFETEVAIRVGQSE